jgi:sec-independent protein translocase protein TatC
MLFALGLLTAYFFVVPMTMRSLFWFSELLNLTPKYEFSAFFSLVGITLLICGLLFTFPLFLILLVKIGIIETEWISKNRKYLYGGLIILTAIVDPDPSLITESLIIIPLVILTEISILVAKRIEKSRERKNKKTNPLFLWGRKILSTLRKIYNR